MGEFDLIRQIRRAAKRSCEPIEPGTNPASVALGIGDDAAVLDVPGGKQVVVSCDTLNEGVHFLPETDPGSLGHKSLAVNLSDMAAMGADPAWFLLSLSLPRPDTRWLDSFLDGMLALAGEYSIVLVGGDTTSGPLSVTITAMGLVDKSAYLDRSGSQPDEWIVVSGDPGLAAFALDQLRRGAEPTSAARQALEQPEPRIELGRQLLGKASACIDVSDGLMADLGHILNNSGVGAIVEIDSIPVHRDMVHLNRSERRLLTMAGGDDYELCFTLPDTCLPEIDVLAADAGVSLHVVGRTTAEPGLRCFTSDGEAWSNSGSAPGYDHFPGSVID
jgi:thiamine-monophosphate kinase